MKRRGFLKLLGMAPAAAAVPMLFKAAPAVAVPAEFVDALKYDMARKNITATEIILRRNLRVDYFQYWDRWMLYTSTREPACTDWLEYYERLLEKPDEQRKAVFMDRAYEAVTKQRAIE